MEKNKAKEKMRMKKCVICNNELKTRSERRKTCSHKCSNEYQKAYMKTDEYKAYLRACRKINDYKAYQKAYRQSRKNKLRKLKSK